MTRAILVRTTPEVIAAYRSRVDHSVDERGARMAIERDVLEFVDLRARGSAATERRVDGTEVWRAGPLRVYYHVHVLAAAIDVVIVRPPYQGWTPISKKRAESRPGSRPQSNLGVLMRHQRERTGHSVDVLAELAGVSPDDVRRLEAGQGIPDAVLLALCAVLDVDVVVMRRRR